MSDLTNIAMKSLVSGMGMGATIADLDIEQIAKSVVYNTTDKSNIEEKVQIEAVVELSIDYDAGYRIETEMAAYMMIHTDDTQALFSNDKTALLQAIETNKLSIDAYGCSLGIDHDEAHCVESECSDKKVLIQKMKARPNYNRNMTYEIAEAVNNETGEVFIGMKEKIKALMLQILRE